MIKNRQDLFDHFFPDNGRRGWWQKGDAYIHRKEFIDSLFGQLNANDFANIIKLYFQENFDIKELISSSIKPIQRTMFKKMQETGLEAELYFINNFKTINFFNNGILEDARLFGDGYDFQISVSEKNFLIEVKGVRAKNCNIRITQNEFDRAKEYKEDYFLTIVSELDDVPKITLFSNPLQKISFTSKVITPKEQTYFVSSNLIL